MTWHWFNQYMDLSQKWLTSKTKIHIQTEENLTCNHAAENIGNEIKNDKSWLNVKCVYIKTDNNTGNLMLSCIGLSGVLNKSELHEFK